MMKRENFQSRLGFLLVSAGCAIGIGNVWKFPYVAGQNGGGVFVLFYLLCLVLLGIPVMTMEFAMGRAAQKSPVRLYQRLEPKGSRWHLHGYAAMAGNYLLMMFYTTVAGWMLRYFVLSAAGAFQGLDAAGVGAVFGGVLSSAGGNVGAMLVVVALGFAVCALGLQNGLERVTKGMMTALLLIMVALAVHSLFLPGAQQGVAFYLLPDWQRARQAGMGKVVLAAMNQAFFTLSLGIGAMAIFGSYIGKDHALLGESVNVGVLDTFVALTSGLIIFPACFAYGIEVDSGPSLIFITLPNLFNHLPGGRFWGSLFFVFMSFAAFSTVLAVFENLIACTVDLTGWARRKACLFNAVLMALLSLPCALGFNLLSGFQPMGPGSTVLDLEDFIVSNLLLPLGSLVFVLFCTSRRGWGWDNFAAEANEGRGLKVAGWMRLYLTWVLPLLIVLVFLLGLL